MVKTSRRKKRPHKGSENGHCKKVDVNNVQENASRNEESDN